MLRYKTGKKVGPALNRDVWFTEEGSWFRCECGAELVANQHGQIVVCPKCHADILYVSHLQRMEVHHPADMEHAVAVRLVADRWLKKRRLLPTMEWAGSWEKTEEDDDGSKVVL